MADTAVAITAGSGTNIDTRTEATNGNHRQVVVLGDPSTNAGVAPVDATAGLKVDLGADNDVTVTGTVTANLSATDNQVLDDILADTAAIQTAVEILDNAISGSEMQVDVLTMPTVAVTQSGVWDEVGINDSGNSITVDNAQLSVVGSGTEAAAMRVTIATDSTGVLSVDDNGSTLSIDDGGGIITVDGTVGVTGVSTVAEQQTQTTHLATIAGDTTDIETAVELIDDTVATLGTTTYTEATSKGLVIGAVRRDADTTLVNTTNEVAPLIVDANGYLKVEVFDGGGSHTVDNNGTFATQVDGAALTALQLIDNSIFVDDADWTADTSSHTLVGGVTQATPSANTDGDTTPLITNALRELRIAVPESDLATAATTHVKKYYTNAGAVTDGIIWSPAAGKRWYVTDIIINVSAAATVTLEDDKAGGDEAVMKFELAANSGISHSFQTPWFSGEDAADLIITTTAGNVYVTVTGYEI